MELQATGLYNEVSNLSGLKNQARTDPGKAAKEVAQQFEALFVGMMLKAMRDAVPAGELFGGQQMKMYQEMFDKQIALQLSSQNSIGMAQVIEQQIAPEVSSDERASRE